MTHVNRPGIGRPPASPFSFTLNQIHLANEKNQSDNHSSMPDEPSGRNPKSVKTGPRAYPSSWVSTKKGKTAKGKEE